MTSLRTRDLYGEYGETNRSDHGIRHRYRCGYRVVVTDILKEEGTSVASDIVSKGGEAEYHHLDVTDTEETQSLVSTVEHLYGPLHTVVANAGIAHRVPLEELTDEKWDQTHEVDLKGVLRVCRAAAPAMRAARRGNMIALSSIMGIAYGALARPPRVGTSCRIHTYGSGGRTGGHRGRGGVSRL